MEDYENNYRDIVLCEDVLNLPRILESRIGCLMQYYCKKMFRKTVSEYISDLTSKIILYSWIFITPVLLSFSRFSEEESIRIIKTVNIQNIHGIFTRNLIGANFQPAHLIRVMNEMYNLCVIWNGKMDRDEIEKIKDTIDLKYLDWDHRKFLQDEKNEFYQPFLSANLLVDSYGVIGKPDYVSKDSYYVREGEGKNQGYFLDKHNYYCNNNISKESCENVKECAFRKGKCHESTLIKGINRKSIGTLKSFYNFSFINTNEPSHSYKTIDIFKTELGNITIFEEYTEGKRHQLIPTKKYRILFPALGGSGDSPVSFSFNVLKKMYVGARLKQVSDGNVRVHSGIWNMINSWYESTKEIIRNIPKDADVYLVGCSLGGAMANVMALKLILEGNIRHEKLHLYAFGAPRIGNTECGEVISGGVSDDSYNFIKLNNIITEEDILYTQFDFVTKMPASEFCMFSDCRFVDNPKIRCMSSGFFFNPVLNTFKTQPEMSFGIISGILAYSKLTPKIGKHISKYVPKIGPPISWHTCRNLAWLNHSLTIYGNFGFIGILNNDEHNLHEPESIIIQKRDCVTGAS